jgi:hypothetical protein
MESSENCDPENADVPGLRWEDSLRGDPPPSNICEPEGRAGMIIWEGQCWLGRSGAVLGREELEDADKVLELKLEPSLEREELDPDDVLGRFELDVLGRGDDEDVLGREVLLPFREEPPVLRREEVELRAVESVGDELPSRWTVGLEDEK